ncbi:hypothetical protein CPB83DRAFT_851279 [Crepidotus variabilis]|uniref:Uncharacterized protein n=1 Tax=Crepidotus variabilis TaxID=179855 RepID=A0A9P6JS79_9AGAR|nr:hypothetical protein CPB83DRAFT_851279 [Crepidotus variabilis]
MVSIQITNIRAAPCSGTPLYIQRMGTTTIQTRTIQTRLLHLHWLQTIDDGEDDDRTYCDQQAGVAFHPFDGDDGNPYMTSYYHNPIPKGPVTPNRPYQASDFNTRRRYSSPNTSVYSVALGSECTEHGVTYPDSATPSGAPRSRPVDIPRTKSKSHGFNPLRFLPRSSGTSWLSPKSAMSTTVRPTRAPPPVQVKDYEVRSTQRGQVLQGGYYKTPYVHPQQSPATTGRSSRAVGHGSGRSHGHWLPHFFSSFAAN